MPISVNRSPFAAATTKQTTDLTLRTPQARILAALVPDDPSDPQSEWPLVTRAQLGVRAGYTAISGTVTRALNGIREGSSSGDHHQGLLERGLIEEVVLSIEGVSEINYRATAAGIRAYQAHIATHGEHLPGVRDVTACTNNRYRPAT